MADPAFDHAGLGFADYAAAKRFYTAALAPLGMVLGREYPKSVTGDFDVGMFGARGRQVLLVISGAGRTTPPMHFAFRAESRKAVDAFYKAAMGAGGRDNGPPGVRANYHPNYYAAFVLDPEGHNIEAVCHAPVPVKKAAAKRKSPEKKKPAARKKTR